MTLTGLQQFAGSGSEPASDGVIKSHARDEAPQIGFDRFISIEWAASALAVRAGTASLDELNQTLDAANLGTAARKKTRTVLNRLWLAPRPELTDLANRGAELYQRLPDSSVPVLSWGMAIATYPFFGKVAELIGRLSSLQGDCTSAEVHRRMSEAYGEREGTKRMTNMVIQTQASWGAIERVDKGKRLVRLAPLTIADDEFIAWLIEAVLRYSGKAVSISALQSMAVIYPFVLDKSLAFIASNSPQLELMTDGSSIQTVALLA
jgi:hypothetical protein